MTEESWLKSCTITVCVYLNQDLRHKYQVQEKSYQYPIWKLRTVKNGKKKRYAKIGYYMVLAKAKAVTNKRNSAV